MANSIDNSVIFERHLFLLLDRIRNRPGVYLGEASLTKLFHFICGYSQAALDFDICSSVNLKFDKEFDAYIKSIIPEKKWSHWHLILCEGRTEEEAFFEFFRYLDSYIRDKKARRFC